MYFLYNITLYIVQFFLKIIALFNAKINLFIKGRKTIFSNLQQKITATDKVIWFHCASLGEFEQGRPILEKVKTDFPKHKILLTFFSPSGFEIQKDYKGADVVSYLPLDTKSNAKKFLKIVHPELAVFVKYEFWPNILRELKKEQIKTILVSAIFRKDQAFFKPFGSWMRKSLHTFTHFFVQDQNSKDLLNSIQFNNTTISGDTRFDRVAQIKNQTNDLDFIEAFKNKQYTLVAGSTWKTDEEAIVHYINTKATNTEKFIIAPHNINQKDIQQLKESITKKTVLFSEKEHQNLQEAMVFIVDTIGLLSKIYSYADIVYVGGAYTKSGVHNVLEPAVFGVPIVIGPNHAKFKEANDLVTQKAISVTNTKKEVANVLTELYTNKKQRLQQGSVAANYVKQQEGATTTILNYIQKIM